MMYDYYGLGHSVFPGFGILLQLLLFLLFLGVVYWVINSSKTSNDSAEEIAKKRYARGDITKKEFEDIKKELNK